MAEGLTVLVVEGDPAFRTVLEIALRRAGHGVVSAGIREPVLPQRDTRPFDVVVVDLDSADEEGFTFVTRWRTTATGRSPALVLLTARRKADLDSRVALLGAAALLTKPVSLAALLDAVAQTGRPVPRGGAAIPA